MIYTETATSAGNSCMGTRVGLQSTALTHALTDSLDVQAALGAVAEVGAGKTWRKSLAEKLFLCT
jgi:hypothetical protein